MKKVQIDELNDWLYQAKAKKQLTRYLIATGLAITAVAFYLALQPEEPAIKVVDTPDTRTVKVIDWKDERTVETKTKREPEKPKDIKQLIIETFKEEPETALAVFTAESHLNPSIIGYNRNGTKDVGIAQINDCHGYSVSERLDPERNIEIAYKIYKKSGFNPWSVYKSGKYLSYLNN